MFRRPVESRHSLREVAEALQLTCDALRARLSRSPRRFPGGQEVRRDGFRFVRVGRRWRAYASPPWTAGAALRKWHSLTATAEKLGIKPTTLRRQLDRHATRNGDGVLLARVRGLIGCKFGDTWHLCADEGEAGLG